MEWQFKLTLFHVILNSFDFSVFPCTSSTGKKKHLLINTLLLPGIYVTFVYRERFRIKWKKKRKTKRRIESIKIMKYVEIINKRWNIL